MTVLDDELDRELSPKLRWMGLELVRPRRWVSDSSGSIRRMFEFQALKGTRYAARWGFSLDFVPAFRSDRFRWKRTAKTAEFDLSLDPLDASERMPRWSFLTFLPPIDIPSRDQIIRVASATQRRAGEDFSRVASVSDVVALFEERSKTHFGRIVLRYYIQTDLAWGLALIANERRDEGETHLQSFCQRFKVERDDAFLRKAELAAAAHAARDGQSDKAGS